MFGGILELGNSVLLFDDISVFGTNFPHFCPKVPRNAQKRRKISTKIVVSPFLRTSEHRNMRLSALSSKKLSQFPDERILLLLEVYFKFKVVPHSFTHKKK